MTSGETNKESKEPSIWENSFPLSEIFLENNPRFPMSVANLILKKSNI